jgi:uncharacterized protein YaaN involved in tellurite resistance
MILDLPGGVVAGIPDGPLAARIVPSKARRSELAGKVAAFAAQLIELPVLSPEFSHRLEDIRTIGASEIARLSGRGARMLAEVSPQSGGELQQSLDQLRALARELDPAREGNLLNPARRLGLIRRQPDPEAYFARYREAQEIINASLIGLARERDAMLRSNVTLAAERERMLADMRALEEAGVTARELAIQIDARAAQLAANDPLHADKLRAEALTEAQQRAVEIARQMAIAAQGWAALDLTERSNAHLIAGASRAIDTMVLVLRGAKVVADALTRHGLVFDRIAALNRATGKLIDEDSPGASGPAPTTAAELGYAFTDLHAALDTADQSRGRALEDMRAANELISRETDRAVSYLNRER